MQRRTIVILGGAAIATSVATVFLTPDAPMPLPPAALAFPGLAQRLANVSRIEVRRHDGTLVLLREGPDRWVLPEKGNYPARGEKVREVLVGLTELRLIEPRTADAAMLDRLGVEDPSAAGATSSLLRLLDANGAPIAELILGRRRMRTQGGLAGSNVPETIYVRRPNETQAWLAEGRLPVDSDPNLWIDRDIANLPRDRVRRVVVSRPGDAPLELVRGGDPDGALRVAVPADAPATDEVSIDEVGRAFEFLTFTDVKPEADWPGAAVGESVFTLTDGLAITLRGRRDGDAFWVALSAAGDDEAARLNARWRGWAYQLGPWKEKAFLPTIGDLVRPPETAVPAPAAN
ncbi:DUF4340 domain-containing protein [Humitalea sp. 24SJ18S-53]|uniref:DUF4340 domain-containing protein n=1 Tax=Humitalea sp. 24SJ18S-53 TaxID=3422307 RepID=UPI003D66B991